MGDVLIKIFYREKCMAGQRIIDTLVHQAYSPFYQCLILRMIWTGRVYSAAIKKGKVGKGFIDQWRILMHLANGGFEVVGYNGLRYTAEPLQATGKAADHFFPFLRGYSFYKSILTAG